ncbi:hypothetical protein OO013_12710 [Mangrovivirga sp. M17]|uniref:Outer membrane beta-barrel protein n=1 Tax=Mangrovivirga halotolerans TaxID=2993936 RepID=A0ABT3RSX4_9BACT|nr:hypothetical protein [Mangrovivirga halotolerans]MCX2744736.1 hypothetical protein [Mangrovivirga halotolerans]
MKLIKSLIVLFFLLLTYHEGCSQIDNSAFLSTGPDSVDQKIYLGINTTGYFKNNEYFNDIVEGYTLFGYNLIVKGGYQFNDNLNFEAGGFFRWDFGNEDFRTVLPYFKINYQWEKNTLTFGNINGWLAHQYIEPLYEFENFITNNPELGIQYLRKGNWYDLDIWVDWQNMIYPLDSAKEEIAGGLIFDGKIVNKNSFSLSIPLQFKVYHRGGQIDISNASLITRTNFAFGLKTNWKLSEASVLKEIETSAFYVTFNDNSGTELLPFNDGNGIFLNASVRSNNFGQFLLSYWNGNDFYSYQGGRLYQSLATEYGTPGYIEDRELIFLRYGYDLEIAKNSYLTLRGEPLYDLNNKSFEYSFALYFNLKLNYPLLKNK